MKRWLPVAAALLAAAGVGCSGLSRLRRHLPHSLRAPTAQGLFEPMLLTTDTAQDARFDVSRRGRLAFASDRSGNMEIWIRSADPAVVEQPRRLTMHSAIDDAPAFSPNGKRIAFVTHREDARGDIAVMSADGGDVKILTGRDSADSEPCWSRDGRRIAFTRRDVKTGKEQVWELDVRTRERQALTRPGTRSPAYSPNGRFLAYTSFRSGPSGDIWVLDLVSGKSYALTSGPAMDGFPSWSADGEWVYFARFSEDTNGDGRLTAEDNASIWRVSFGTERRREVQLTSGRFFDLFPRERAGLLFYATNSEGNFNVAVINAEGVAPHSPSIEEAQALARRQLKTAPRSPYDAIVALRRILSDYGDSPRKDILAWARLEIADQYAQLDRLEQAKAELRRLIADYPDAAAQAGEARVRLAWYQALTDKSQADPMRAASLRGVVADLKKIGRDARYPAAVRARAWLRAGDAEDLLGETDRAVSAYQHVIDKFPSARLECAEAALHKANIYKRMQLRVGGAAQSEERQQTLKTYLDILRRYPDARRVCQEAARQAIGLILEGKKGVQEQLRRVIKQYKDLPVLPAMAQNRIADVYYRQNELARAKDEYRKVASGKLFPNDPEQIAAAKFALARIYYEQEQYKKCLDIYAQLTQEERQRSPEIFSLARAKYIRRTLDKADREFRLHDIRLALKTYRGLMNYDWSIVEAHRGYIECHDALDAPARRKGERGKMVEKAIAFYRAKAKEALKKNRPDAVSLYGWGLALTYLRPPRLDKAEKKILLAASIEARIPYFHQTLGWIYEQRYRKDQRTIWLEKAVSRYQAAAALLDRKQNPRGYADLLLNLGNVYLKLGNVVKAHEYYAARAATGEPFRRMQAQGRFYENYARAASQLPEPDYAKSVRLYQTALAAVESLPGDHLLWRAQLWAKRGLSCQEGRLYEQAIEAFSQARRLYGELAQRARNEKEKKKYQERARLHLRNVAYNTWKLAQSTQERSKAIVLLAQALEAYKGALAGLMDKKK